MEHEGLHARAIRRGVTGTDAPYDSLIQTVSTGLAFVIGAFVGSFLNVAADRLPVGGSVVAPRSYCMTCLQRIAVRDLAPIISYAWLRGRCRHCGVRIPIRVVAVEAVTGALFAFAYLKLGYGLAFGAFGACTALLLTIAVIDLEHRVIPNRLVVPASFVLVFLAPLWPEFGIGREFVFEHAHLASLVNSLVAGVGGLSFFLVVKLIYPAGMGSGDVKMAGMLGLMVGYPGIVLSVWAAAVFGGAAALVLLTLGGRGRKDAIPFGPFLSFGGIAALLGGAEVVDVYLGFIERIVGA